MGHQRGSVTECDLLTARGSCLGSIRNPISPTARLEAGHEGGDQESEWTLDLLGKMGVGFETLEQRVDDFGFSSNMRERYLGVSRLLLHARLTGIRTRYPNYLLRY